MFFEKAWNDLQEDKYDKGLWARLYSENCGDVEKTKAAYLKERVQQLRNASTDSKDK